MVGLDGTAQMPSERLKKPSLLKASMALKSFLPCTNSQIALEDVTVGDTANANRKLAVNAPAYTHAFDELPNRCQTGVEGQAAGQYLIVKSVILVLTLQVNII